MLSNESIEQALKAGYEQRGFEIKGPGSRTDTQLLFKVIRAAISMGNLRDGGHVVVGIDDKESPSLGPGLTAAEASTWTYDDIARKMAEYVEPPLRFDLEERILSSGATVIVIQIFEFSDMPHLCIKGDGQTLRKGALYVRPRKVPETSEIASNVEMRDILDLAAEKRLRAYVATAERAGVQLLPLGPSASESYATEREHAWHETPLIAKVASKAHWNISIRPKMYSEARLEYARLEQTIANVAVRFRGWPVPFVDDRRTALRGNSWVGQDIDAAMVYQFESWRFFSSGQFGHLRSISADWRTGVEATNMPRGYSSVIEVWEIVYYVAEIFELAARLALNMSANVGELVIIDVRLNIAPRTALVNGQRGRAPLALEPYEGPSEPIIWSREFPKERIVSDPRQLSVLASGDMLARFGFNPPKAWLEGLQNELLRQGQAYS